MSDIWERKIRTFFRRFDLNKDGKLTREEFVSLGDGVAGNEKFDSKQKELLKQCLDDFFTRALPKKSDVLTEDSFVESLKTQRDDPGFKKSLRDIHFAALNPMDVNRDGYLDAEEFRRIFEGAGIVESDFTKAAFDELDTNHDGKLSFEEFHKAFIDYFCSDAESSTAALGLLF